MSSKKYSGPLSEGALALAKKELREDDSSREQSLAAMREWVERNPRIITSRMDESFILRFLRFKKYSLPIAQETLERYLLLRQTLMRAFQNLDYKIPRMEYLIDNGYLFATPGRDSLGRRWIIARPGVFDPYKFINEDMCRVHGIVYETLLEDEENQVRGFVHYADGAGVTFPYLTLFTPREAVRIVKNGERTLPMRHKEIHVINSHPSVKYVLDWALTLISEKIRKRVKIYTNAEEAAKSIEELHMLPKEYGGTMPMAEMIELFKKELEEKKATLLSNDNMSVRLEMFSESAKEGALSALKGGCNPVKNDICCGSFRKLEVD